MVRLQWCDGSAALALLDVLALVAGGSEHSHAEAALCCSVSA
jgi:hypothetical protein